MQGYLRTINGVGVVGTRLRGLSRQPPEAQPVAVRAPAGTPAGAPTDMIGLGWPRGLAIDLQGVIMFSSIVVGTDGSDTATQAVREAVDIAGAVGATLELVSAYTPVSEQRLRAERREAPEDVQWAINPKQEVETSLADAADIARKAGVNVNTHARQGDPADAILDVAEEQSSDLVILGNKGMTGAKRFLLGSVPDKVSHHAPCSVLIVRTT